MPLICSDMQVHLHPDGHGSIKESFKQILLCSRRSESYHHMLQHPPVLLTDDLAMLLCFAFIQVQCGKNQFWGPKNSQSQWEALPCCTKYICRARKKGGEKEDWLLNVNEKSGIGTGNAINLDCTRSRPSPPPPLVSLCHMLIS